MSPLVESSLLQRWQYSKGAHCSEIILRYLNSVAVDGNIRWRTPAEGGIGGGTRKNNTIDKWDFPALQSYSNGSTLVGVVAAF